MISFGILTDLHSSCMGYQETTAILPSNEHAYVGAPHHLRACWTAYKAGIHPCSTHQKDTGLQRYRWDTDDNESKFTFSEINGILLKNALLLAAYFAVLAFWSEI